MDYQNKSSNKFTVTKPEKFVDEVLLEKLSRLHLSDKIISSILGISEDTLHRRYSTQIDQWKAESKAKIAEILFDEAINNRSPWALKLFAQRFLDSPSSEIKDITPQVSRSEIPVPMSLEEKLQMVEELKTKLLEDEREVKYS